MQERSDGVPAAVLVRGGRHGEPGVIGQQREESIDVTIGEGLRGPGAEFQVLGRLGWAGGRGTGLIEVEAGLIAAYGDGQQAVIVYDTRTSLVPSGPAAECVTVEAGRITYSRFIFDRTPFAAARRASPQA